MQTYDEDHPQLVRFDRVDGFTHHEIEHWAQQALSASAGAYSDGLKGFTILSEMVNEHIPCVTGSGPAAVQHPQLKWVNTLLANLKTAFTVLSFRQVSEVCSAIFNQSHNTDLIDALI